MAIKYPIKWEREDGAWITIHSQKQMDKLLGKNSEQFKPYEIDGVRISSKEEEDAFNEKHGDGTSDIADIPNASIGSLDSDSAFMEVPAASFPISVNQSNSEPSEPASGINTFPQSVSKPRNKFPMIMEYGNYKYEVNSEEELEQALEDMDKYEEEQEAGQIKQEPLTEQQALQTAQAKKMALAHEIANEKGLTGDERRKFIDDFFYGPVPAEYLAKRKSDTTLGNDYESTVSFGKQPEPEQKPKPIAVAKPEPEIEAVPEDNGPAHKKSIVS